MAERALSALTARPAVAADFAGAEVLVEDAGEARAAWQQLERLLAGTGGDRDDAAADDVADADDDDAAAAADDDDDDGAAGWMAWVEVGGDAVLVKAEAGTFSIWAPAGSDPDDAALAARRVHGRLGAQHAGWDLDR